MVAKCEKTKQNKTKPKTKSTLPGAACYTSSAIFGEGPAKSIFKGPRQQLLTLLTLKPATGKQIEMLSYSIVHMHGSSLCPVHQDKEVN